MVCGMRGGSFYACIIRKGSENRYRVLWFLSVAEIGNLYVRINTKTENFGQNFKVKLASKAWQEPSRDWKV